MSFTDFAFFNGSVRRDKAQESVMQTWNARERFLKNLEEERQQRLVVQKRQNAASVIQKFYRRYASKKRIHDEWRREFDKRDKVESKESLLFKLSRLALFYTHPDDNGRLISLSSQTLSLMRTLHLTPSEVMPSRTRMLMLNAMLRFLKESSRDTNITMPIRFLETFAFLDSTLIENLINMGYMSSVLSVSVKAAEVMGIAVRADGTEFQLEETIPPRLDAIIQLLLTPLDKCDQEKRPLVLRSLLLAIDANENVSIVVRIVLPFIRKNIGKKRISLSDLLSAYELFSLQKKDSSAPEQPSTSAEFIKEKPKTGIKLEGNENKEKKLSGFQKLEGLKMAWLLTETMYELERDSSLQDSSTKMRLLSAMYHVVPQALNAPSDSHAMASLSRDTTHKKPMETEQSSVTNWLRKSIDERLSKPIFKELIFEALNVGDNLSLVVGFERQLSGMIDELAAGKEFMKRLWNSIASMGEHSNTGIPMTIFGQFAHADHSTSHTEHLLGSALALFCNSLKTVLATAPDSEFTVEGTLQFEKPLFLYILRSLREVCLNLINLAFPEWAVSSFKLQQAPKPEHESLMNTLVEALQAVYQKDVRMHFLPEGFWSDHLRQIVISRGTWHTPSRPMFAGRRLPGVGLPQNRNVSGYMLELFRARQRNSSESDESEDEQMDTTVDLSVSDKRNLCILRNIPFIVPFQQRIKIFHDLLEFDKQNLFDDGERTLNEEFAMTNHTLSIRREQLYEDAFAQLQDANKWDLRRKITIRMINPHGIQERGVDGGGIFRDFLTELLKTGLDPQRGFFAYTHDRLLYPNPIAMQIYAAEYWRHFYFLGRMLAKLVHMKMMAEIRFAEFFIAQLLGQNRESTIELHHMLGYDPELYRHLKNLLHCSPEEVDSLQLDFSILVEELGNVQKIELKPGGSNIPVTVANRQEFVRLYVNYYLFQRIEPMVLAMRDGVSSVLSIEWLAMFSPLELQTLVSGIEGPIDVVDMRRHCLVYQIRDASDDAYIGTFWEVVDAMSPGDQRALLKFVTGCSRPPIEGFAHLEPKMGITLVDKDPEALPTSATCMNLLTLPKYVSRERLEEKLRYAINSGAGFELE